MQIIGNTPVLLRVSSGTLGDVAPCLAEVVFLGLWCGGAGFMLFSEAANLVAPGWAEVHGLYSQPDWEDWIGVAMFGLFLPFVLAVFASGLFKLLFGIRCGLALDRTAGVATLSQRGLFRLPDRAIPLGQMRLTLSETAADSGGPEFGVRLTGASRRAKAALIWYSPAMHCRVTTEQAGQLRPWLGRLDGAVPVSALPV